MSEQRGDPDLDPKLAAQLEAWSEAGREAIDAATRETSDEDRRLAREALSKLSSPGRRRPSHRPWLLAAAVVAAFTVGWLLRGVGSGADPERRDENWLDQRTASELLPNGKVPTYDRFSWTPAGSGSARYGLRVWNADDDVEPALSVDDLSEAEYAPSVEERKRLGPSIRWEVYRQDLTPPALVGSESASRSSSD